MLFFFIRNIININYTIFIYNCESFNIINLNDLKIVVFIIMLIFKIIIIF